MRENTCLDTSHTSLLGTPDKLPLVLQLTALLTRTGLRLSESSLRAREREEMIQNNTIPGNAEKKKKERKGGGGRGNTPEQDGSAAQSRTDPRWCRRSERNQ